MIRTFFFWLVCSFIVAAFGPVFLIIAQFDKRKKIPTYLALFWCWCMLRIAGVKIKVEGREILEKFPQYVIVSNHQSYFDIFALIWILKKIPHFLAKKELFRIPIFGWCLRAADVIEIDRENPEAALSSIKKALAKGVDRPIAIFPEGTRSVDGQLQPFRKKGLFLLMDTGLPFIPIAFYGTRNAMPKGSYRVRPANICLAVGEPIHVKSGMPEEEKEDLRSLLWRKVYELRNRAENICKDI